jgi:hypothetical protein
MMWFGPAPLWFGGTILNNETIWEDVMEVRRRTAIKIGGAAVLLGASGTAMAEPVNPLAAFIAADGGSIKAVHVTAGDGGHSQIADTDIAADHSPYPLFKQFLTHKASATAVYAAPPRFKIAGTKNTAKTLLFIVAGETTLEVGATKRKCPAGTVILMDEGSGAGVSEKAGPDGYTGFKVALAD